MAVKYSIIVPCYNEEENIPLVLERFREVLRGTIIEVIMVDNGSTDGSAEVLKRLLPEYPFARTVRVEVNQGYGYGVLQGLRAAKGEYIGWMHADMQTDPGDAVKAFRLAKRRSGEAVFVKGRRQGRPLFDEVFTKGMSFFESVLFGKHLYDINAQPNVFPRSFFEEWENPPYDFSLDLYAYYMAKQRNMPVVRFPVQFPERVHGSSKWNTDGLRSKWKFIKRTVKFSIQLKRTYGNKTE